MYLFSVPIRLASCQCRLSILRIASCQWKLLTQCLSLMANSLFSSLSFLLEWQIPNLITGPWLSGVHPIHHVALLLFLLVSLYESFWHARGQTWHIVQFLMIVLICFVDIMGSLTTQNRFGTRSTPQCVSLMFFSFVWVGGIWVLIWKRRRRRGLFSFIFQRSFVTTSRKDQC